MQRITGCGSRKASESDIDHFHKPEAIAYSKLDLGCELDAFFFHTYRVRLFWQRDSRGSKTEDRDPMLAKLVNNPLRRFLRLDH